MWIIWIVLLILFVLVIVLMSRKKQKAKEDFTETAPNAGIVDIICTTTLPGQRQTTNTLALDFIKNLQQDDIILLSGVYVDLDPANADASFLSELKNATSRGAKIYFFTDPVYDSSKTYNNYENIKDLLNNNAYWFAMGTGNGLQSHIKLLDVIYFKRNYAIFYYGSYNPFSPETSEAGVFIRGSLNEPIIQQSFLRDKSFFDSYIKLQVNDNKHSPVSVLQNLSSLLGNYCSPDIIKEQIYSLSLANVIYAPNSYSQCVSNYFTGLQPSVLFKNSEVIVNQVQNIKYSIGFMPQVQVVKKILPSSSAEVYLFLVLDRAQEYIKMGLLFDYLSDDYYNPSRDPFQKTFIQKLKGAYDRGVYITLYVGVSNQDVPFLDKPRYGKFIDFLTGGKQPNNLRLLIYPSYSLHFKFYVTERDVLISNNMPSSGFYISSIQGVDLAFYDCPEINTFFDNTYNGFISTFSDNLNSEYLKPDSVYSVPKNQIATKTNLLTCGNGTFRGEFGCCIPEEMYPFRQVNSDLCRIQFLPSYVDDPYNPDNFFMVMLNVINSSNTFIIIINEFTHLGCDDEYYPTLDDWNQTPQRKAVNKLFNTALLEALGRGVLVYIVSSQGSEVVGGKTQLKDTLSPSLKKKYPQQVFTVDVDNLNYIYTSANGARATATNGQGSYIHDKLYVTDNYAYVGGQNWYSPLELDAGFLFAHGPIYFDLRSRAQSLVGMGYEPIKYTIQNPYVGPILDMKTKFTYSGSVYPILAPLLPNGDASPFSVASYNVNTAVTGILDGYIHQLDTASGDLDIFCWTMSPVEFFVQDKNNTPYFINTSMLDAIKRASARNEVTSITIVLCLHSFKYELAEYKDPTKDLYCTGEGMNPDIFHVYKKAYDELYELFSIPKITVYLQGMKSDRVPESISSCNLFHAKTIASSTSISASSANYTPGYFFSASNTGVIVEIPLANRIYGYSEFRKRIFDLQSKKCETNCGTETNAFCLNKFIPKKDLTNFCL